MHAAHAHDRKLIDWDDRAFALGVADMDATHREFIDLLNLLDRASDAEFPGLFERLVSHTRAHFESEEARMRQCGFPAISEHTGEHWRILGELTRFRKRVDRGLVAFGRAYVRETLPAWFRLHAATMDSALAAHWKRYSETRE